LATFAVNIVVIIVVAGIAGFLLYHDQPAPIPSGGGRPAGMGASGPGQMGGGGRDRSGAGGGGYGNSRRGQKKTGRASSPSPKEADRWNSCNWRSSS
jgi:hypothetical protein